MRVTAVTLVDVDHVGNVRITLIRTVLNQSVHALSFVGVGLLVKCIIMVASLNSASCIAFKGIVFDHCKVENVMH